jgi:hypothetical protein
MLLVAYPRSTRSDLGEEMAALVGDRRLHGREPLWRLWPSLLHDTARSAVVARWEAMMTTSRAILIGALTTLAVLALLSVGPVGALPIVIPAVGVTYAIWRYRPSITIVAPQRSWRRWTAIGAFLLVVAFGYLLAVGDEELSAPQWMFVFFGGLAGMFGSATGLVLFVTQRRRSFAG